MENINFKEEGNFTNILLGDVDWKGISQKDINQIKHEVEHWYTDYSKIQDYKKLLGEDIGESFEEKFDKWIINRIEMVLDRE